MLYGPLRALGDGLDMNHFLTVPVFDRTYADRSRDAKDIIAVACSQKGVVGIPITRCQFQLRLTLAIDINRLFLVEIDTIGHVLRLYGYAMMMQLMVGVHSRIGCPLRNRIAVPRLSFGVNDGVARAGRIRRRTNAPERRSHPRGTGH